MANVLQILGAIGGLLGVVFGTPAIILFFLNKKNANRKLDIEDGTLEVSQFDAQTKAYQDLLDRATAAARASEEAAEAAQRQVEQYREERETLMRTLQEQGRKIEALVRADEEKGGELIRTNGKLERLRELFLQYVERTGIPMTPEEQKVFEDTAPSHIFRQRKEAAHG